MVNRREILILFVTVLVAAVAITSSLYFLGVQEKPQASGIGYLNGSQLAAINTTSSGVNVDRATSTIYINSTSSLPVFAGPMNAPSMYSFEILGIINPEIVIKEGVTVHFVVVNIDTDSRHNFVLTTVSPPYNYMIGQGMMGNGESGFMTSMPLLPPVNSGHYAFMNTSYDFHSSGLYWYVCTNPGHAQKGMYGKILVTGGT